jgi:hypothetical protein
MASLHIVIGFDGPGNGAKPFPVYVGRLGSEARAAMEKSDAARFEIFNNVFGLRKSNPRGRKPNPAKVAPVAGGADPAKEKKPCGCRPKVRPEVTPDAAPEGGAANE